MVDPRPVNQPEIWDLSRIFILTIGDNPINRYDNYGTMDPALSRRSMHRATHERFEKRHPSQKNPILRICSGRPAAERIIQRRFIPCLTAPL